MICRKTESKASWLACWLSLVRADLDSANRLELPVPFSCEVKERHALKQLQKVLDKPPDDVPQYNKSQFSH